VTARAPRAAGGFIGACLAVALIVLALPSGGQGGVLPASLEVSVESGAAIAAVPAAPDALLQVNDLRPAGPGASAGFELVNQAGRTATVGLRAEPSSAALDGQVRIEIEANGATLADSTLAELRAGTPGSIVLGSGESRHLRVSVSVPGTATDGFQGGHVAVLLVPEVRGEPAR
jgi:hypothetical protein